MSVELFQVGEMVECVLDDCVDLVIGMTYEVSAVRLVRGESFVTLVGLPYQEWVASRFVLSNPSGRDQIEKLQLEVAELKDQVANLLASFDQQITRTASYEKQIAAAVAVLKL